MPAERVDYTAIRKAYPNGANYDVNAMIRLVRKAHTDSPIYEVEESLRDESTRGKRVQDPSTSLYSVSEGLLFEAAEQTGISDTQVVSVIENANTIMTPVSLDREIGYEEGKPTTLAEHISVNDGGFEEVESKLTLQAYFKLFQEHMRNPLVVQVLFDSLVLGLNYDEIADKHSMSREKVRSHLMTGRNQAKKIVALHLS